jgi:hypothetical protein
VLEETAVQLEQAPQRLGSIAIEARHQDVVVGTLGHVDGIHLYETNALDGALDRDRAGGRSGIGEQTVPGEEEPTRRGRRDARGT